MNKQSDPSIAVVVTTGCGKRGAAIFCDARQCHVKLILLDLQPNFVFEFRLALFVLFDTPLKECLSNRN